MPKDDDDVLHEMQKKLVQTEADLLKTQCQIDYLVKGLKHLDFDKIYADQKDLKQKLSQERRIWLEAPPRKRCASTDIRWESE